MIRYFYLRDTNGQPVGCLAMQLMSDDIKYGISVLNPKDIFNRDLARSIAYGRLMHKPVVLGLSGALSYFSITQTVLSYVGADVSAPTRARKAAKLWLRKNKQSDPVEVVSGTRPWPGPVGNPFDPYGYTGEF